MVKEELQYFKSKGIRVKILNLPTTLIDLEDYNWVMDMVNSILIEVYTSLDEEDYRKRRQRQRAGIDIAKDKGMYRGGRGVYDKSGKLLKRSTEKDFIRVYRAWDVGTIRTQTACEELGISRSTYYRRVYEYEVKQGIRQPGEKKERRDKKEEVKDE